MAEKTIRWGLLGGGAILDRWMKGARQIEGMEIVAVASRTAETAQKQAAKFGIPEAITYEEMIAREDIDIVYVPVPHTAHKDLAIRAMEAGKHVLVEKPAAVTAADFKEMAECAKKNNVFLMEAVWTRFFPVIEAVKKIISEGTIGEVRMIHSAFAFRSGDDYQGRLFDPNLAGGGLLDVGVYNLHFSRMIMEKAPVKLIGTAAIDTDHLHLQVDEQASFIAQYDNGAMSVMSCGVRTSMIDTAVIYGTKGYIIIPGFWKPQEYQLVVGDQKQIVPLPVPQKVEGTVDEGYQFEIRYVNECLRQGMKESPYVSWDITTEILSECDELRKQWGLKYPFE